MFDAKTYDYLKRYPKGLISASELCNKCDFVWILPNKSNIFALYRFLDRIDTELIVFGHMYKIVG